MKKMIIALAALAGLCSCTGKQNTPLVAYFSATGTTRAAAEILAEQAGADLLEIVPEVAYTDADLDWRDSTSRSTLEMKDRSSRPAIKTPSADAGTYDTVYIGFPVWWGVAPTVVNTFIESADLTGKTVVVFATSGGSTTEGSVKAFQETYPDIEWVDGGLLNEASPESAKAFLSALKK